MRLVAVLWVAFVLNYVDRQAVFSMFPALRQDLGFTNTELGLTGAVFLWVYSLSSPLGGWFADRFRRDHLVIASLIIWSVMTACTGLARDVSSFLLARALMGFSEALYLPAALSLLAAAFPESLRSRALAFHGTGQMVGTVTGGWLGGLLAERFGWSFGFLALAAVGLLYAPLLGRTLPPTPPVEKRPQSGILRSWCYWALVVASSGYCLVLWMMYAWFPDHLQRKFGLSLSEGGLMATLWLQGSTAASVALCGILADRLRRRWPSARFWIVCGGIALSAPFAWLAMTLESPVTVILASLGFGLAAGGLHSNLVSAAYDVIPPSSHGKAVGLLNLIGGLAGGAAILAFGQWRGAVTWITVIAVFGALLLAVVLRVHFDKERASRDLLA